MEVTGQSIGLALVGINPRKLVMTDVRMRHLYALLLNSTGRILENWQGMEGALWKTSRNVQLQTHRRKRDMSFSAVGVGGNPKTGIKFYGKGSASLEVTLFRIFT